MKVWAPAAVTWSSNSTCFGTASGEYVGSQCVPTYEALGHAFIGGGAAAAAIMLVRAWRARRAAVDGRNVNWPPAGEAAGAEPGSLGGRA